jgi:hypothetical protein
LANSGERAMAKAGKRLKKAYEGIEPDAPPVKVEEAV